MITVDRFIATSSDKAEWLKARETGVTATQVSKAATESGFAKAIENIDSPEVIEDNAYMAFGRDNEHWIVMSLKQEFGVLPNDWLIAHNESRWQMATPDALSPDHTRIAEVKTTGTDWGSWDKVPIHYRRQVQWQLHVTGATDCVFAWLLRVQASDGTFVPAWFAPKSVLVARDEKMIAQLVETAEKLHDYVLAK
jgi:hypothetical protein